MCKEMIVYAPVEQIDESVKYKLIKVKDAEEKVVLYNCKDIEDNKDSVILGFVKRNKDVEELKEDSNYLVLSDMYFYEIFKKKKRLSKLLGYFKVDSNNYIGYTRLRLLPILLPLFLLICSIFFIICFYFKGNNKPVVPLKDLADTVFSDGIVTNNDLFVDNGGSITFAGYDLVYATKDEPTILLENPDTNDVYFTYEIILNETGAVLLEESDLIPPGQALPWNAFSLLEKGDHVLTFNIYTYDMNNTEIAYTPAVMDNVTIKIY